MKWFNARFIVVNGFIAICAMLVTLAYLYTTDKRQDETLVKLPISEFDATQVAKSHSDTYARIVLNKSAKLMIGLAKKENMTEHDQDLALKVLSIEEERVIEIKEEASPEVDKVADILLDYAKLVKRSVAGENLEKERERTIATFTEAYNKTLKQAEGGK